MAVEMAIWRMTGDGPRRLDLSRLDLEQRLEDMLAEDPGMSGIELLVIGRQVRTRHGGLIDLLALDEDGRVHVLEIKRDRTSRDVVSQVLDYGSWVKGLDLERLEQIHRAHHDGETDLADAFADQFGSPLPDAVNVDQQLTIVASELDPTSDRIVEFLAESYGVPINAVFFRHFSDGDRNYLMRTWLLDDPTELTHPVYPKKKSTPDIRDRSTPEVLELVNLFFKMVKERDPGVTLNPKKHYIGLMRNGNADNYIEFRPRMTKMIVHFRIPRSDEVTDMIRRTGIDTLNYDKWFNHYRLSIAQRSEIEEHRQLLIDLLDRARSG